MSTWQVFIWEHLTHILQNLVKSKPSIWDYQKMAHLNLTTIDTERNIIFIYIHIYKPFKDKDNLGNSENSENTIFLIFPLPPFKQNIY